MDASNVGIGAVLSQVHQGDERVIAYYSQALSKPERNYCTTRRELLAIVKAIDHFHPYLYGRKFTITTDHASLQWLLNFKNPEGQIARWLDKLQTYDFCIVYRTGRSHQNADVFVASAMLRNQLQALSAPRGKRWGRKCDQHAE